VTGTYRLTREAHSDLRNLWNYIASDNFDAADRYLEFVFETMELIAKNPELGRRCDRLLAGARRFVAKRHLIFYRIEGDVVGILRVRETQDISRIFRFETNS
jgi:toxin ParE1/3/4